MLLLLPPAIPGPPNECSWAWKVALTHLLIHALLIAKYDASSGACFIPIARAATSATTVPQVFIDAPHPASGAIPRDVSPYFGGPYYEWFTVETMVRQLKVWVAPLSSWSLAASHVKFGSGYLV
eukprot:357000-Chlamydomonas_euryale.AAC.8